VAVRAGRRPGPAAERLAERRRAAVPEIGSDLPDRRVVGFEPCTCGFEPDPVEKIPWKLSAQYWNLVEAPSAFAPGHQVRITVGPVVSLPWGGSS
jgi:hypothetical protein